MRSRLGMSQALLQCASASSLDVGGVCALFKRRSSRRLGLSPLEHLLSKAPCSACHESPDRYLLGGGQHLVPITMTHDSRPLTPYPVPRTPYPLLFTPCSLPGFWEEDIILGPYKAELDMLCDPPRALSATARTACTLARCMLSSDSYVSPLM